MPVVATVKSDWFRVINEISRFGISLKAMARELDVARSTLIGWKQGASPSHHHGEALIDFWCCATHQPRENLPVKVVSRRFVFTGHRRHSASLKVAKTDLTH